MKYIKTFGFEIALIIIFSLIYTILYYFDITSSSVNNVLKIISFILVFSMSGIYIGKRSNKKGYLEGLKISLVTITLFISISLLFKYKINIYQIVYYLIILIVTTLSSMIGINFKKRERK